MSDVAVEESWVETDAGRLFAAQWRPAPAPARDAAPIVLLHDSLGCVALWRDFPERLARATGRRVVAYDRLGFGRSDANPRTLDANFVHDEARVGFQRLREVLDIDAFVAFGHSVGGGMAIACAAAWPEACRALITESAQTFVEDRTLQGIVDARQSFAQPGQVDRLRRYHGDKAEWVLHAWIDTWLAPEFAGWNLDDALRAVRCPALAMHGGLDEFGSPRHPQRIGDLTGGRATVELMPDCGHVPHREEPERVLDLVRTWLSETGA